MSKPTIAGRQPVMIDLDPGTYFWCSCGLAKDQPFCDGSHQGTAFTPVQFDRQEKKKVALCMCKHTSNAPFCDGAHVKL